MDDEFERLAIVTGIVSPTTSLATLAFGATATPTYAWSTEPFSVIGAGSGTVALAFDAGPALGAWSAWTATRIRGDRGAPARTGVAEVT